MERFWDKPVLMDLVSDLLIVFGVAALAWAAVTALQRLPLFPLRQVVVASPVVQVGRGQIEGAVRSSLVGNFFTVNLDGLRAAFEKLPWVRSAEVRRRWPDGIVLSIEEQVAVARWLRPEGEVQLVNTHGELFAPGAAADPALPVFSGPDGSSADVLDHYHEFSKALAAMGRRLVTVALTDRMAWELKLDDGVVVELGRDQEQGHPVAERLARFVEHYPAARDKLHVAAGVVDMRYPNGFALRPARKNQTS
jgi:cell division protein FtsQ